jgi:hypothetical protein
MDFTNTAGTAVLQLSNGGAATFSSSVTSLSSSALVASVTSNPSNDAIVAARWTSGVGMEIRYLPDFAYGYIQNTYQAVSGQPFGDIYFRQNVGGTMTTRMTIKADGGNVLIGTTTNLGSELNVNSTIRVGVAFGSAATIAFGDAGTPYWSVGRQASSGNFSISSYALTAMTIIPTSGNVLIGTTTDIGQRLQVSGGYIAQVDGGVRTFLGYDGTGSLVGTTTNHYLRFITNDTERMRIISSGYVGIGTSNPRVRAEFFVGLPTTYPNMADRTNGILVSDNGAIGGRIGVADRTSAGQGYPTYIQAGDLTTSSLYYELRLNPNGGAVFAGSSRLDNISDGRVKDNIQPITNSLDKVLQLTGKKFHLKDEPQGKVRYGFIAQDLEGILDEFVIQTESTFTKDDLVVENIKSIENWASSWAALLVEAIKEQQKQIEELKNKLS